MIAKNKKVLAALIAVCLISLTAAAQIFSDVPIGQTSDRAYAASVDDEDADENVYLVWKESDFKTSEDYVLKKDKEDGSEYTYTFSVESGTRLLSYYIEYLDEKYYPNADGAVELEKGTYKIYFNPDFAYGFFNTKVEEVKRYYLMCAGNLYTENDDYALAIDESNTDYDEYKITVNFTEPATYVYYIKDTVSDTLYYSNTKHYEEITEAGNYVIAFSPVIPYDGIHYTKITKTDKEIYYLLYRGNNFKLNAYYILELDEDGSASFDEYVFEMPFFEETDFAYYIYASKADRIYYPNADGFIRIDDEGDYTIKFSPDGTHPYFIDADGNEYYTTVEQTEDYFPDSDYYLMSAANGYTETQKLSFNEDNGRFDEYTFNIEIDKPVKYVYYICAKEIDGDEKIHYYPNKTGVIELKTAGNYVVKFSREHTYFTEDGIGYFTTVKKVGENALYYLMCAQNDFKIDGGFALEFDADNDAFDEYVCYFDNDKAGAYFAYYIYDAVSGAKYYPNKDGVVYLSQIDDYAVRFSLANNYNEGADDDGEYFTCVELREQNYGGYYLIGNFNGYRYQNTQKFYDDYRLNGIPMSDGQKGYDYKIELDVTADMIDEYETVQYFISDGETRYRAANGKNFAISKPGKYAIYFTPADDATVYHYAVKEYDSIDGVDELVIVDENDNFVYIEAAGLTSDMEAKITARGKYSYIEIKRNGKSVKFDDMKITYYVGNDADKYTVAIYADKTLTKVETEHSARFISFKLASGTGFIIEERDNGLPPVLISIIIAAAASVLVITVIMITRGIKKKKQTLESGKI
ncbi:MAG: hypothetical protein LBP62_00315 [Clostridiales bacterium]|jgi:hypothetical protein|nr:hypothetical protein [Clostridiales bacterium]